MHSEGSGTLSLRPATSLRTSTCRRVPGALGTVIAGAFDGGRVARLLNLSSDEHPMAIMPVGRPA